MISYNNLYQYIYDFRNAEAAYFEAASNCTFDPEVMEFERNRNSNLIKICNKLKTRSYIPDEYRYFTIYTPKERLIVTSTFRDKIVHHMWNNLVYPILDNRFYYHSYASRKNKGAYRAVKTLHDWLYKESILNHNKVWVINGDIHAFYPSINHDILKQLLLKYFDDDNLLWLSSIFIDNNGYNLPDDIGLPIGILPSQLYANLYGNMLDEYVKRELKCDKYMRYMDNFIVVDTDYNRLEYYYNQICNFIVSQMKLLVNPKSHIDYAENGINFLGFRFFPYKTIPSKETIRELKNYINQYNKGNIPRDEFFKVYIGKLANISHVDAYEITAYLYSILESNAYKSKYGEMIIN